MQVIAGRTCAVLTLVLVATSASQSALAQECLVHGDQVTLEAVTVRPHGAKPFLINIQKMPVTAKIPRGNATTELRVDGPIAFTASRKNVWFTVVSDYASPDGTITLRRGAHLVNARVERDRVVAAAVLYAEDVLEGENKDADEIASPIRIPCSLLTLGSVDVAAEAQDAPEQSGSWWEPKAKRGHVHLRLQANDSAPSIDISTPTCENCIQVKQLGEQGQWLRVERTGAGVTIRGWMRRAELKRIPDSVLVGRSYRCSGDHGSNGGKGVTVIGTPPERYEGPALVRSGTRVFSNPPKGEWAVFKSDLQVDVRHDKGSEWVELQHIPGLDDSPGGLLSVYAHVSVSAVTFPSTF